MIKLYNIECMECEFRLRLLNFSEDLSLNTESVGSTNDVQDRMRCGYN